MTKLYSEDNLFTTFNNIEKIKKSKEERKLNKVIRVEEMIKAIREHYNLNAPMLANNLGVDAQTVYKWERGSKPNIKRYNKIKELYEGITREDKGELLEVPEITTKVIEKDVTAWTPFISLTIADSGKKTFVNINKINEIGIFSINDSISIYTDSGCTSVRETPAEILELIRKKLKENEKN